MNVATLVVGLVGLILGGGGVGALLPVFRFRADKGSVIAVGAEAAVTSLTAALARSDTRLQKVEAENQICQVANEELRIKVETLTRDFTLLNSRFNQLIEEKS